MTISKIGAKVKNCNVNLVQSKREGGFFFIAQDYEFCSDNLITKRIFISVLSVHSKDFGHTIYVTL